MLKFTYEELDKVVRCANSGFQPFRFAGGLYDRDTKLVHFGAREYDPSIGRWISRDPIGFKGGDTNLYGYVLNAPINFIDSDGLNRKDSQFGGSGGGIGPGAILVAVGAAAVGGTYVTSCQSPPVKNAIDFLKSAPDFVFDPQDPNEVLPEEVREFERQEL